jgi:hypothetical protein
VVDQVERKTQVVAEQVALELQQVYQYQHQQPILLLSVQVVLLQLFLLKEIMVQILYFHRSHQRVAVAEVVMVLPVVLQVVQVVVLIKVVLQVQELQDKEMLEELVEKTEAEVVVVQPM